MKMSGHYEPHTREASEQSEWLTLGQAARYLGVAQSTLRKWCDASRVPAFTTPGGHRRFRKSDLDEFVSQSSRPDSRGHAGPLILVIDDEPGIPAYVRASLEPEGYEVEESGDVKEGLRLVETRPPDLIMVDVTMPGVEGWEILRRLREKSGEKAPSVILFSAVNESDEQLARSLGVKAYFGRPLDPRRLVESAREALPI
ncbi:MAG: response regulator [Gaiellaceae bacterium]|jgi:excisionase family DNA binding protein